MKLIPNLAVASLGVLALSSCTMFNDNLSPCPEPAPPAPEPTAVKTELTFRYDYNMDYADKFAQEVHCLDLFVFDKNGNYVYSYQELDNSKIKTGTFSVPVELLPGDYTAIAFGGTACENASFEKLFTVNDNLHYSSLNVDMKNSYYYVSNQSTDAPGNVYSELTEDEHASLELHNLYYGSLDFTVTANTKVTLDPVKMQRNTNAIKVTLKYKNNDPINKNDFHLTLEDDNNWFDYRNNIKKTGLILYRPYVKDEDPNDNVFSAQFTVSRIAESIAESNAPKIYIRSSDDRTMVAEIPVLDEIKKYKQTVKPNMPDQEYFDRENSWEFEVTIGNDGAWGDVSFEVKDWDVNDNPAYDFE